ncbi:hypothetical protein Tco_0783472 [Tanacetum coccineum]
MELKCTYICVNLQPLSVELGPGILGNIFDGILRFLKTIARISHDMYQSQLLTRIDSGNSSQRKLVREILSLVENYMFADYFLKRFSGTSQCSTSRCYGKSNICCTSWSILTVGVGIGISGVWSYKNDVTDGVGGKSTKRTLFHHETNDAKR